EEEEGDEEQILTSFAVTLVPAGANRPAYVLFSSHTEMLVKVAERMLATDVEEGFAANEDVQKVAKAMKSLGANKVALDRISRLDLARRIKYELLRKGELKDSDSVLASLIKSVLDEQEIGDPDPIRAAKLPEFEKIQQYFTAGGNFVLTTDDGWTLNGFILKQ
ncbi:MAG: membrane or secreted protein, partial [Planctomycetota bacterium]